MFGYIKPTQQNNTGFVALGLDSGQVEPGLAGEMFAKKAGLMAQLFLPNIERIPMVHFFALDRLTI